MVLLGTGPQSVPQGLELHVTDPKSRKGALLQHVLHDAGISAPGNLDNGSGDLVSILVGVKPR